MREMQETLHPMLVHFHIGLLATAFGFEVVGAWRRHAGLRQAAFYMLIVGFLGLLVSVPSGLWAAALPSMSKSALVHTHWNLGIATAAVLVVVVALRVMLARGTNPRPRVAAAYAVLLACGVALMALTGYYGARVVWG